MITSVSRKIILADIANLAEIACIADIAKLAKLAKPSRLRIADKVSRAEPSRFSNGHLYLERCNWKCLEAAMSSVDLIPRFRVKVERTSENFSECVVCSDKLK